MGTASGIEFVLEPADVSRALSGLQPEARCTCVELVRPSRSRPIYHCHIDDSRAASATFGDVVIAKGHGKGDGARVHEAATVLWERGFGLDPRLRIPRPIAFISERSIALQELASGPSLYEAIDDPTSAATHLPDVAAWLLKLHSIQVTDNDGFVSDRAALVAKVGGHAAALAQALPEAADRVVALADFARRGVASAGPGDVVTHGDFQPKNIHLCGDSVIVIDLDRVERSSPARDVGHFLAQCMTMSFVRTDSFGAIRAWITPFLKTYEAGAPEDALEDLAAFFTISMLEILYYRLVVKPVRDPSFVEAWLDEAERRQLEAT